MNLLDMNLAGLSLDQDAPASHGSACHSCGGPIDEGDRFCSDCGSVRPRTVADRDKEGTPNPTQQRHLRCKNCGSQVATDPEQRSYVCPFCDSAYVVEFSPEETDRQAPEFVIGFSVTREEARDLFRQWTRKNHWFRPGDLKTAKIVDRLKGIYLPFWSFSMLVESDWSASIGEYWYRTETYTTTHKGRTVTRTRRVRETEWWPLSGNHHRYYSGYLVSGSRGLSQQIAARLKPFHLTALKRYQPYFLAGWLCEEYSVSREVGLSHCEEEFLRREKQNVGSFMPGDEYRRLQVQTQFSHVNSDLILLPVYMANYRHQDKIYRVLINGQTGKLTGDKPVSPWRIAAAILTGLLLVALLVILFLVLSN